MVVYVCGCLLCLCGCVPLPFPSLRIYFYLNRKVFIFTQYVCMHPHPLWLPRTTNTHCTHCNDILFTHSCWLMMLYCDGTRQFMKGFMTCVTCWWRWLLLVYDANRYPSKCWNYWHWYGCMHTCTHATHTYYLLKLCTLQSWKGLNTWHFTEEQYLVFYHKQMVALHLCYTIYILV